MTNPVQILLDKLHEHEYSWQRKSLARNEFLVNQGEINDNIYLVRSGSFRVFLLDEMEEYTIRFGYQGSIFGALDSYITGGPTDYFIQAIKESSVDILPKDKFDALLSSNQNLKEIWTRSLELLIYQQMEREKDLLIQSPLKRYNRVLKRSPELFQQIPSKYIASYLRMSPETLSRLKKS